MNTDAKERSTCSWRFRLTGRMCLIGIGALWCGTARFSLADQLGEEKRTRRLIMPYALYEYNQPSALTGRTPITGAYLERLLAARAGTLDAQWQWAPISSRRHAFHIRIVAPATWREAFLCVDGEPVWKIPRDTKEFEWTFHALPWGRHQVALLVVDDEGRVGVAERFVRIR